MSHRGFATPVIIYHGTLHFLYIIYIQYSGVMKKTLFAILVLGILCSPRIMEESQAQDFDIRGRLHMDTFIGISEADDFSNGFNNRRARIGVNGRLSENWDGRLEVDFAGGSVSANDFRMRRTFSDGSRLWLGQYKVPQGLNELTSSNNISFIERATNSNMIADARRMGIAYERFGDRAGFKTMVFGRAVGQRSAIEGDMPLGVALRGVFAPQIGPGRLHAGASVVYEDLMDNNSISFSDRPEARDSKGGRAMIGLQITDIVESTRKYGFELAYIQGPIWIEGEYLQTTVKVDTGSDPTFNGWHLQAGYVLTGESRAYSTGGFGSVSPSGSGAWEVSARYSHMSLNDGGFTGGEQTNITLGVNRYVTSNLRFMGNIIFVNVNDTPEFNGTDSDGNPIIVALRAQFNF